MRIRFLVSMVGAVDRHPHDVADVEAAEAKRLIAAGYAEATSDAVHSGAPTATAAETTADPKAGVEFAGKRLFGAAAAAVLKRLAKGG